MSRSGWDGESGGKKSEHNKIYKFIIFELLTLMMSLSYNADVPLTISMKWIAALQTDTHAFVRV